MYKMQQLVLMTVLCLTTPLFLLSIYLQHSLDIDDRDNGDVLDNIIIQANDDNNLEEHTKNHEYVNMQEHYTYKTKLSGLHMANMKKIQSQISSGFLHTFSTELGSIVKRSDPEDAVRSYFMSPAILENDDGTHTLVSRCRNVPQDGIKNKAQTNVLVTRLYSSDFQPLNMGSILGLIISESERNGPRDSRMFRIKENPYIVFDMQNWRDDSFHMYMLSYTTGELVKLQIYSENKTLIPLKSTEKNWCPLVSNDTLYFIYDFDPLIILECSPDLGRCKIAQKGNGPLNTQATPSSLRGGTPVVLYKWPYYVSLAHSTTYCYKKRLYGIHIVIISVYPQFRIVYLSTNIQFHPHINRKRPVFPTTISSFIFPTTLLLREEDMADMGGHLNDIDAMLFRIRGFRSLLDQVIEIDKSVPVKKQVKPGIIQEFIQLIQRKECNNALINLDKRNICKGCYF